MTAYEHGFLTKCAEHGIDAGTASAMVKQAILWSHKSEKQTEQLRKLQNEMLQRAYVYGYDKYLPDDLKGGEELPGKWFGRWIRRMVHGRRGFAESYRGYMEQALDKARERYQEEYNHAPDDVRRMMDIRAQQRETAWNKQRVDAWRAANPDAAREFDRQKAEAEKAKQQTERPQGAPMTDNEFRQHYFTQHRPKLPAYRHMVLGEDGRYFSNQNGVPLSDAHRAYNFEVDEALRNYRRSMQPQPAKPNPQPVATTFNPPTATYK